MIKNKSFLILVGIIILNFCLSNASFAVENTTTTNSYPDYAYEFIGKDKFETFNRKIFAFNLKANKYIIRPINVVWASVMPQYGMDRVDSFYTNLKYPVRLVGCLLQKDFKSSKSETVRFFTNTTLGVGGLYDPARTRFKIEPHQEDVEQALAQSKIKKGPYLVVPIVAQGNIRDLAGEVLDLPLNPCTYIVGPIALASTGLSLLNQTTNMQPVIGMMNNYADPYEVAKQAYGIERYIKNTNLDRSEVFKERTASQNIININTISQDSEVKTVSNPDLKADIELNNYNPQSPEIDALRTMLFDSQNLNDSKWAELSVWNKSFNKKIKTASVIITPKRHSYSYRYILQKNKTAPLAILYPSIGEGIMSNQSKIFAKMLYDSGYSVVIEGSPFQWEFVKSMPKDYRPGLPYQDAKYLRLTTSKILTDLQHKNHCEFNKKILVGTSFGGITTLFVAAQEENDNTLGISNYIAINPPIEIFYALKQIDKFCQNWQNNPTDIKERAAITAKKIIQVSQTNYDKNSTEKLVSLPLTEDEAQLAISFAMKLKLSDLIYTIEKDSKYTNISHKVINNMSFNDYAEKYIISSQDKPFEELSYDSSLYSINDFLQKNNNYKIYHTLDDCFVNPEQLIWLKKQSGEKSVFFSNGSHMGVLYRNEFKDEFKKDIELKN